MKYKFLEHTADVKFNAYGKTIEKAFENSALALKETMCGSKAKIKKEIKREISAKGKDFESLLYNFLEEILYLFDADNFVLGSIQKIKIEKDKFRLKAVLAGDKSGNYRINNSVKAITYNDMFVKKDKAGWKIQAVIDV